ncbi:hypothetical protein EV126DRAFT_487737 [Verticillium dahliae]|nr:hypothetical protein EV126DRAFT_487737 [Verticillium dahliae]
MVSPLPPPAPTPPTGAMVPPTGDRTSNLLNLLNQDSFQHFQQHQHQPQPPLQQQQQQQPQHPSPAPPTVASSSSASTSAPGRSCYAGPCSFPDADPGPCPFVAGPYWPPPCSHERKPRERGAQQHDAPPTGDLWALATAASSSRTSHPSIPPASAPGPGQRIAGTEFFAPIPAQPVRDLRQAPLRAGLPPATARTRSKPNQDGSIPVSRLFGNSYNNYEDHQTSSSQHHTPKSSNAAVTHAHSAGQSPAGPPFLILKKGRRLAHAPGAGRKNISHERSPLASPQSLRSQAVHSTVSPAGNAIGNPTPGSAASLASPGRADRNPETYCAACCSSHQKELDRAENSGALEKIMSPEAALEFVRSSDAAAGHADHSNEAAAASLTAGKAPTRMRSSSIEEEPAQPVKRPQLAAEAIMDIARLKKEFDQIDRNLYTATERYIVYGMSKSGGRIFNVAMSCTAPDHDGAHRETIIGTGISGTVFWVQILNGEKDHIEDANPEQYGFALPPMSFHEETRRVECSRLAPAHPPSTRVLCCWPRKVYYIIWPSFIMQQNLFKPGHDRVVDTEQLAKQCSLKINTGKAGKDFTFSQDDTVIVSLDKSGRVKFWDVRDLTAAKEGSDPRAPTPAHTSLEVKEPMLTLTSTPEGEKAWPTSVLLVDKLRPYQKRCALQFNLPHSKESDAVCSVMYHAPTGMLIIGHPTRNSIYFAHLSAPKYNLKSVSQVDYIKRLIDHDTTIPQPDSTAVISGVREYSLPTEEFCAVSTCWSTPAMSQDSDEPTLFELYAMHSKGVACLLIKQAELGWSKDNKVLAPVSAVDAGVVSISKLKPPHALPAEPAHQEPAPALPAPARSNTKESTAHTAPSSQDETATRPTAASKKQESKDEDTPTTAPVKDDKPEKAERKGRKKKAAAVAAAAALAAESQSQSNGGSQSPRVTPKDSKSATAAVPAVPSSYVSMESIETVMNSLTTMESRLNSSFAGTINAAIKSLHTKLEDGQREREKDFDQHQKTLLTMISDVLNENTQKVLESLIQGQFDLAMPTISDVARKAVSEQFSSGTNRQLSQTIQKEINKSLPSATQHALQSTDFIKGLSDRVGSTVAANVQREVVHSLTNQMSTAFTVMATTACQQVADDLQRQHHSEMTALHEQRAADSKKIDELHTAFAQLTSMHQLPPAIQGQEYGPRHGQGPSQVHSQGLTQMQQQPAYGSMQSPEASQHRSVGYQQSQASSHGHGQHGAPYQQSHANSQALTLANQSQGEEEFDQELADCVARIDGLIKAGRTEDALLRWLQSGREQFIFDRLMSKYSPQLVLDGMPGLLLLTIATTICQSLDSVTRERVAWLEVVVHKISTDFDNMEADARAITPKIFHLIITNTENLFVRISSTRGNDPILKNLSQMMGVAKRTLETHSTRHYG